MKNKLNKQLKQQWINALTSGKYKQGIGVLKIYHINERPSYCCLGVLCQITRVESQDSGVIETKSRKIPDILKGGIGDNEIVEGLVAMNDNNVPFEVIAGFINENL